MMRSIRARALACAMLACATAPAAALDLPGALREAAAHSPALESQRAMAAADRARIAPAGAWAAPMLELGVQNVPASGRFDMDPMTMRMVGLSQRLPVNGALGLERRAAAATALASAAGAEAAHAEAMGEVWRAYAAAWGAAERARLAHAHESEMDALVRAARARYDAGGGDLGMLARAEAERARTRAEGVRLEADAVAARAALAERLGRDPAAAGIDSLAPPPPAHVAESSAGFLATIGDAHPRLRALAATATSRRDAARAARRMAWPDLEAGVSWQHRGTVMGVRQDDMWSATLGVMLPVFAGRRAGPMGDAMDAMARSAAADLRAERLALVRRVVGAHAAALAAQRRTALLADTLDAAEHRALASAWAAFTTGRGDMGAVLDVMHALYEDDMALADARQDLAAAEGELAGILASGDGLGVTLPAVIVNETKEGSGR